MLGDEFCRTLLMKCRVQFEKLRDIPVIAVDLSRIQPFEDFLVLQRAKNAELKQKLNIFLQEIVEILCSKCEDYVLEAAESAPVSVSNQVYNSMKLLNSHDHGAILKVAKEAREIVREGTKFDPTNQIAASLTKSVQLTRSVINTNPLHDFGLKDNQHSFTTPPGITNAASIIATSTTNQTVSIPYTIRAAMRLKCRKLVALFRLTDFMIRDAYYDLINLVFTDLLSLIVRVKDQFRAPMSFGLDAGFQVNEDKVQTVSEDGDAFERERHMRRIGNKGQKKQINNLSSQKINHGLFLVKMVLLSHIPKWQTIEEYQQQFQSLKVVVDNQEPEFSDSDTEEDDLLKPSDVSSTSNLPLSRFSWKKTLGGKYFVVQPEDFVASATLSSSYFDSTFISAKRIPKSQSKAEDLIIISNQTMISFNPGRIYCLEQFEQVLKETALICSFVEGLFFEPRCQNIFTPVKGELSLSFNNMLEDRIFLDNDQNQIPCLLRNILTLMNDEFQFVQQEVTKLNSLRLNYHDQLIIHGNGLRRRLQDHSAEQITNELTLWDNQLLLAERLIHTIDYGILRIDLVPFRNVLISAVKANHELYSKLIPELYVKHGDAFFHEISSCIDRISAKFSTLEEFIKVVEAYHHALSIMNQVDVRFTYIMHLRDVIESRGVKISDAILRQNLTLTSTYNKFQLVVNEFEEILEAQIKVYRAEMVNRLKVILIPFNELKEFLATTNDQMLQDDFEPNIEQLLKQLDQYRKDIELVSTKLRTLDYYQTMLNIVIFEKGLELDVLDSLHANLLLWRSWKTVLDLTNEFMQKNFLDANCEKTQKSIATVKNDLTKHSFFVQLQEEISVGTNGGKTSTAKTPPKGGKTDSPSKHSSPSKTLNPVNSNHRDAGSAKGIHNAYLKILQMSTKLLSYIPIIQCLQSKTLKVSHMRKIHKILSKNIFGLFDDPVEINNITDEQSSVDDGHIVSVLQEDNNAGNPRNIASIPLAEVDSSDITVGELVDSVRILDYAGELEKIYEESRMQYNLESKYTELVKLCESVEFIFDQDHENKSFVYIANFHTIIESFEDVMIDLRAIRGSKFSDMFQLRINQTIENFSDCLEIIHSFAFFQKQYFKQRLLFGSARVARSLSSCVKPFKGLDEIWRYLIKATKSAVKVLAWYGNVEQRVYTVEKFQVAMEYIQIIQKTYDDVVIDHCEKYPRLYCLDHSMLQDLLLLPDIKQLYLVASQYMFGFIVNDLDIDSTVTVGGNNGIPNVGTAATNNAFSSKVVFGEGTAFSGLVCLEEHLTFAKPCMGRSNIIEWFKNMEVAVQDRLEKDVKELIVDHFSHPLIENFPEIFKYCEQSLILSYQVKFWDRLRLIFNGGRNSHQTDSISVTSIHKHEGTNSMSQLKSFHAELNDQINMITSLLADSVTPHNTKIVSNMLMLMLYCRDLLKAIVDAGPATGGGESEDPVTASGTYFNPFQTSFLFFSIEKGYDKLSHQVFVKQGGIVDRYGMKYQGFTNRLAIVPTVEKCFFAINQSFRQFSFPVLSNDSPNVVLNHSIMQQLHYELGNECLVCTYLHGKHSFENNFIRLVQASIRTGMVMLVDLSKGMVDDKMTAFITNALSVITQDIKTSKSALHVSSTHSHYQPVQHSAYGGESPRLGHHNEAQSTQNVPIVWNIHGNERVISEVVDAIHRPRFAFMFRDDNISEKYSSSSRLLSSMIYTTVPINTPKVVDVDNKNNRERNLQYLGQLFRPISVPSISFQVLLTLVLSAHNFAFVHKLAERLEEIAHFLCNNRLIPFEIVKRLIFQCVKHVGMENEHSSVNVSMQLGMIVKKFFSLLPSLYQQQFTEADIRLFCNLFLEIVYNPITDKRDFQPLIPAETYGDILYQYIFPSSLHYGSVKSVSLSNHQISIPCSSSILQMNKKKAVLVVGHSNVGKSTLIQQTLQKLQSEQIRLKQDIASGRSAQFHDQYQIKVHDPPINFDLLMDGAVMDSITSVWNNTRGNADLIDNRNNGSMRTNGEVVLNPILAFFEKECLLFSQNISTNDQCHNSANDHSTLGGMSLDDSKSTMHYYRIDCASSSTVSYFLPPLLDYLQRFFPFHNVTFICELIELKNIDPTFLVFHSPIVHVAERSYDIDAVLEYHLQDCIQHESFTFQKLIKECKENFIRPCIQNCPADSWQSSFALVKNILRLISSLFQAYIFPCRKGKVESFHNIDPSGGRGTSEHRTLAASFQPFDDDTVRRIVLFACIWTVGNCSPTSRRQFEDWFKVYFAVMAEESLSSASSTSSVGQSKFSKRIFPIHDTESIFDFVLIRQEGSIATLLWTDFSSLYSKTRSSHPEKLTVDPATVYQRNDCQIELLFSSSFSSSRAALMLPTSEIMALSIIQSALSSTIPFVNRRPSCLLLTGEPGTGKSSLFHQLLRLAANPVDPSLQTIGKWNTCARWICHFKDKEKLENGTQSYILSCKSRMLSGLFEQSIERYGAIFIEDISMMETASDICGSSNGKVNSRILIKHLVENEHIFDSPKLKWKKLPLVYCLATADVECQQLNNKSTAESLQYAADKLLRSVRQTDERLIHNSFLHCTTSSIITRVFSLYLLGNYSSGNVIPAEIIDDLIQYTINFFKVLQSAVEDRCQSFNWISNARSSFQNAEKVLLWSYRATPVSVWCKWTLSQLSTTLHSMSAVTISDVIRVLDRILADMSNRFATSSTFIDVFNEAHEIVLNNVSFLHPSFLGMLEKERSIRVSNLEGILYGISPPLQNEGISYSRGCGGFFRSGSIDVCPTVWTGEFTREVIAKRLQIVNGDDAEGIQGKSETSIFSSTKYHPLSTKENQSSLLDSYYSSLDAFQVELKKKCLFYMKKYKNAVGFWNDVTWIAGVWAGSAFSNFAPKSSIMLMLDGVNGSIDNIDYENPFASIKARVELASQVFPSCTVKTLDLRDTDDCVVDEVGSIPIGNGLFDEVLFHMLMDHEVLLSLKRYLYIRKYGASAADYSRPGLKQSITLISSEISNLLRGSLPDKYLLLLQLVELRFQQIDVHTLLSKERHGQTRGSYFDHVANRQMSLRAANESNFPGWSFWLLCDSSIAQDLPQSTKIVTKLHTILDVIQSFSDHSLKFLSLLMKSDSTKSLDFRSSDSVRVALDGFYARQHFVIGVNCDSIVPVEQLLSFINSVNRSNFEVLHILAPHQDFCAEESKKRLGEQIAHILRQDISSDKNIWPENLCSNRVKLCDLHWRKDAFWENSITLGGLFSSFAICTTHMLKKVKNECYLFIQSHSVFLMKFFHCSQYMELLWSILNYVASQSKEEDFHKTSKPLPPDSVFFSDMKYLNEIFQTFHHSAIKGSPASIDMNGGWVPTELKGIILSILLLSPKMISASHIFKLFSVPFPSQQSSSNRRPGERDNEKHKIRHEEASQKEASMKSILEYELLCSGVLKASQDNCVSNPSINSAVECDLDNLHYLSLSTTLSLIHLTISSALRSVDCLPFSEVEQNLYKISIHRALSIMRNFLAKIIKLYLMLPANSSLKNWLVSFLFALFTYKRILIHDFSILGIFALNEVLELQLEKNMKNCVIEEGKISYVIHCDELLGIEVDSMHHYLYQVFPWYKATFSQCDVCNLTILPNDCDFIGDVHCVFMLSNDFTMNPPEGLQKMRSNMVFMSALRCLWLKRVLFANEVWSKVESVLFSSNYQGPISTVMSQQDDEIYCSLWNNEVHSLVKVMDAICGIFHSIMYVKFDLLRQGSLHVEAHDGIAIKNFILSLYKKILAIAIEEVQLCDNYSNHDNNNKSELGEGIDDHLPRKTENSPTSFAQLFSIVCKKFLILYLPMFFASPGDDTHSNEESAYIQCLWNIVMDMFFSIGSNPFHMQQYYSATNHMGLSHSSMHQAQMVGHHINVSCRVKFLAALRYLSFTENISKSTKIFMKYGLIRREKQSSSNSGATGTVNSFKEEDEENAELESEDQEQNVEEDIILSDTARAVLKTCFGLSSQFISHIEQLQKQLEQQNQDGGHPVETIGHTSFFQRYYPGIMSHECNSNQLAWSNASWIISSIDKNVEDWMDWIADPSLSCYDLPVNEDGQVINFLDQIMISVVLKPLLLPGTLLKIVCNVGFGIYEKIDRIERPMNSFVSTAALMNGGLMNFQGHGSSNVEESLEVIQDSEVLYFNRNKVDRYLEVASIQVGNSVVDEFDDDDEEEEIRGNDGNIVTNPDKILLRKGCLPVHHIVIPMSFVRDRMLLLQYFVQLEDLFRYHLYGIHDQHTPMTDSGSSKRLGNLLITIERDQSYGLHSLEIDIGTLSEVQRSRGFSSLTLLSDQKLLIKRQNMNVLVSVGDSISEGGDVTRLDRARFVLPPYDTLTGLFQTDQPPTQTNKTTTLCRSSNQPGSEILSRMNELLVFMEDNFSFSHSVNIFSQQLTMEGNLGEMPSEYNEFLRKYADRLQWLMIIFHISVEYYFKVVRWKTNHLTMKGFTDCTFVDVLSKGLSLSTTLLSACNTIFALMKQKLLATFHDLTVISHQDGGGQKVERPPGKTVIEIVLKGLFSEDTVRRLVVDTIYYPTLMYYMELSELDYQQIETIFATVFAEGSLSSIDGSISYQLLNRLQFPQGRDDSDQFMETLRDLLCEGEISPQDESIMDDGGMDVMDDDSKDGNPTPNNSTTRLISTFTHGSGYGQSFFDILSQNPIHHHQHMLYLIEDAIVRNSQIMLNLHDKFHSHNSGVGNVEKASPLLFTGARHSLRNMYLAPNSITMMAQVKTILNSFLEGLPEKIRLDQASPAIQQQMELHMIGEDGQIAKNKGLSATPSSTAKSALNPMPPTSNHRGSSIGGATKRRAGQRIIIRFQSREFDPVWAYLLMEVLQFNKALQNVKSTLTEMIEYGYEDWLFYAASTFLSPSHPLVYLEADAAKNIVTDIVSKLLAGYLPAQWSGYHDSFYESLQFVKVDSWFGLLHDKRKMLFDWLEIGDPIPATAKLHLLDDPQGLFFALKESFAFHMDTSVDKVRLHFECLPLAAIPISPVNPVSSTVSSVVNNRATKVINILPTATFAATGPTKATTYYSSIDPIVHNACAGCHVYLANIYLNNGIFSGRTTMLELLPDYHSSSFGSVSGTSMTIRKFLTTSFSGNCVTRICFFGGTGVQ